MASAFVLDVLRERALRGAAVVRRRRFAAAGSAALPRGARSPGGAASVAATSTGDSSLVIRLSPEICQWITRGLARVGCSSSVKGLFGGRITGSGGGTP